MCLCNERQAENEKTSLTAKLERITAECERMKKDALLKSSTVDSMMKQQEEENAELHKAVKKLKDQLRTASEDGKRAGRMVEGLKKQVEELRLESVACQLKRDQPRCHMEDNMGPPRSGP